MINGLIKQCNGSLSFDRGISAAIVWGEHVKRPDGACQSCPECGEVSYDLIHGFGADHRVCANPKCRQEWFTTVFYPSHINNTAY